MDILYIHGFASTGDSEKAQILKNFFKPKRIKVFAPTLDVSPRMAVDQLKEFIGQREGRVFTVGSSLGGFYSWYLACTMDMPGVQINPLCDVTSMQKSIGKHQNLKTGRGFEFTSEHFRELLELKESVREGRPDNLNLFLALDDELLDPSMTREEYRGAANMFEFRNGGHRFTIFESQIENIESIYRDYAEGIK